MSNKQPKSAHSKLLSSEARRILSQLECRPIEENDIHKEENGRPFFPGHKTDFSISHSGAIAAVSLVKGGNFRTGCDIQIVEPRLRMREIAEEFFSAAERDYIGFSNENQIEMLRFFRIWTLKECYLKLRGLSVFNMGSSPSFISGEDRGRFAFGAAVSAPLSFKLYELSCHDEHYMLASVVEAIGLSSESVLCRPLPSAGRGLGVCRLLMSDRLLGPSPEIRWFSQSSLPLRSIAEINAALRPAETLNPNI